MRLLLDLLLVQRSQPEFHWGQITLRVDERFLDWTLEYLRKLPSHPDRETTRNIGKTLSNLRAESGAVRLALPSTDGPLNTPISVKSRSLCRTRVYKSATYAQRALRWQEVLSAAATRE